MSWLVTRTWAGSPSSVATRAGPCDSPAVSHRSTKRVCHAKTGHLLLYQTLPRSTRTRGFTSATAFQRSRPGPAGQRRTACGVQHVGRYGPPGHQLDLAQGLAYQ